MADMILTPQSFEAIRVLRNAWTTEMLEIAEAFDMFYGDIDTLRLVGGCVRDLIRGETPKDIDLCTPLAPDQMVAALEAATKRYDIRDYSIIPTGLQHGTITVHFTKSKASYEITTLRSDLVTDGRHAEVAFVTDYKLDAERRDFTMNAMSVGTSGVLYDYFGGHADAISGRVRFVGDPRKRIEEDYLRILRFYRFSARMGVLAMDSRTAAALVDLMPGLGRISGERIWAELSKIMLCKDSDFVLDALYNTGFVQIVFELPQPSFIGFRNRTLNERLRAAMVPVVPPAAMLWAWFFYAYNGGNQSFSGVSEALNGRLHLSGAEFGLMKALDQISGNDLRPLEFQVRNGEITLEQARIAAKVLFKDGFDQTWVPGTFPIRGKDLIAAGMKSGPEMGQTMRELREHWATNFGTPTKDELMDMVQV